MAHTDSIKIIIVIISFYRMYDRQKWATGWKKANAGEVVVGGGLIFL